MASCRRSNTIAAEREEEPASRASAGAKQQQQQQPLSATQDLSRFPRLASSREALTQAALRQQEAERAPYTGPAEPGAEPGGKQGIRKGRGSVPAVPKQGKPGAGLDRDLRDEIDAW